MLEEANDGHFPVSSVLTTGRKTPARTITFVWDNEDFSEQELNF